MRIDEHASFRAHNEHSELHRNAHIQEELDQLWSEFAYDLLTPGEWVYALSELPPL